MIGLKTKLKNIKESCSLIKTPIDAQPLIIKEVIKNFNNNDIIFIANDDADITRIEQQIRFFGHNNLEIVIIPAWDCLPYDLTSPKPLIANQRIKSLYKLAIRNDNKYFFIITSINSFMQKTLSIEEINDLGLYLEVGSKISIAQISQFLINKGYERQAVANDIGDFAVRGGIIDIVMQQAADLIGYRIDFFGEEVESIKIFDPLTQISQESVKNIEILPASEVILTPKTIESFKKNYRQICPNWLEDQLYNAISDNRSYIGMEHFLPFFYNNNLTSLIQYSKNPIIFNDSNISNLAKARKDLIDQAHKNRSFDDKHNKDNILQPIDSKLLYKSDIEVINEIKNSINIEFCQFEDANNLRKINLEIKATPDFALAGRANKKDPLELVKDFILAKINEQKNLKIKIFITFLSQSFADRITKILPDYEIYCHNISNFEQLNFFKNNKINSAILQTHFGFYCNEIMLIGEQAIFGEKKITSRNKSIINAQRLMQEGLAINESELVVHRDHGIGKFDGIHTINTSNVKTDMIKIIYGGNDILFVPVDDINLISRYGSENPLIQLDRLGVSSWKNRKNKIKKKIKIAAEELLKIAAARKLKKSAIFYPNQNFYDEFCRNFLFIETQDQLQAIDDITRDLAKGMPMDRLICGDVGFGKTEVAMRAAAIIISNNCSNIKNQIAIITPTTLLCKQHYKNFSQRFNLSNIKIVQLSRLIKNSQAKIIRSQIESGEAEIIIGTHSLLQNNIKFKNLALVIIDEEQHFGVAQKEKLKKLRNNVHLLNLSATPIPRTLQMSLTGVKDLSLIATPPLDRLSVRNFIMPYDDIIVKEAIMREYNRGGKIFFVVPRVKDLIEIKPKLQKLLPDLKIASAHGQMSINELDDIMNQFSESDTDILLSTTIIESGIDISIANTMIIFKAEMFGLSQLYQLRGRVGRSKLRGYCYFMIDKNKKIKASAKKKLEVMQNLDSLGAGFNIASHDMDIRGSGNLLGDKQSGHIKETGVELYQQMLLETIEKIKNSPEIVKNQEIIASNIDYSIQIKLSISLLIPKNYIEDLSLRMTFYKKIALIKNDDDQEALCNEMNDRFGKIPQEVSNLIEIAKIKHQCYQINVTSITTCQNAILIAFKDNKFKNPDKLLKLVFSSNNKIKINPDQKLVFYCQLINDQAKINKVYEILKIIQQL